MWDTENRLITAVVGAATNGYTYDALGRRLAKRANGLVTTFVHDGAQVIAEYEAPVFQSQDVGGPALPGSFSDDGAGTITISGGGVDIWSTADQFHYAYLALTGDGTITARVTSLTNTHAWAKAGVMLRDSLVGEAINGCMLVTSANGVSFQRRKATGGTSLSTKQAGFSAPRWVRITRSGNTVTGFHSADGITWSQVGTDTVTFSQPTIYAGLAVTSHNSAMLSTATFTNVSITGQTATTTSPVYARGYVYGSYVDELLAILPASGVAADRKFVHSNHLYSVAALTDNSGAVVERYRYDAYGNRTVLAADGVTTRTSSLYGNQVGFTGRYLDKETGLWYFRARYYSGSLGRFVSRDQLLYVDGMSMYSGSFVPNYVDPTGNYAECCRPGYTGPIKGGNCCNGQFIPAKDLTTGCCTYGSESKTYNKSTHCCENGVIKEKAKAGEVLGRIKVRRFLGPGAHQWLDIEGNPIGVNKNPQNGKVKWISEITPKRTEEYLQNPKNFYEWEVVVGNNCCKTKSEIYDCVWNTIFGEINNPESAKSFNIGWNNCRNNSQRVVESCCARIGSMTNMPPSGHSAPTRFLLDWFVGPFIYACSQ